MIYGRFFFPTHVGVVCMCMWEGEWFVFVLVCVYMCVWAGEGGGEANLLSDKRKGTTITVAGEKRRRRREKKSGRECAYSNEVLLCQGGGTGLGRGARGG